jgi:hypothetical protein
MPDEEFLPCPFCGGGARPDWLHTQAFGACDDCGALGPAAAVAPAAGEAERRAAARLAWNRRGGPPPEDGMRRLEELAGG